MDERRRTFFVTSVTHRRERLFIAERYCLLLIDVLLSYRQQGRYALHEFVLMPEHLHLLITPTQQNSLERAMQFVKGGYSYRIRRELRSAVEIWQPSFTMKCMTDAADYRNHKSYIHENPVRAGLAAAPQAYRYGSAAGEFAMDEPPEYLRG